MTDLLGSIPQSAKNAEEALERVTRWLDSYKHDSTARANVRMVVENNRELRAQVSNLKSCISEVYEVIENTEEINPDNYDHELVCALNDGTIEAHSILRRMILSWNEE